MKIDVRESFIQLAQKEKVQCAVNDQSGIGADGSQWSASNYRIQYQYKGNVVEIENDLGSYDLGTLVCYVSRQPDRLAFKITARSIVSQLFNRKKSPLIIAAEDRSLIQFMKQSTAFKQLCEWAKKERFQPIIIGENHEGRFRIRCRYDLAFNNKEYVLAPLSDFMKVMIDFYDN